ncbi:ferredoxin thioredoxin reductase, variable chain [Scenedesmus sp. NREL 46B-D3]|nr:ferredoxin thioredoxin reductase, variable chain [Scenedesmus sp. NREL 46B-D3]
MMLSAKPFAATTGALVSRSRLVSVRVVASDNGSSIKEGAKVKVTKAVKVYHAAGRSDGMDLEGMVGVVKKNVLDFKGKQLSANLPYQVQFEVERNGKPGKLLCHLDEEEIEVV